MNSTALIMFRTHMYSWDILRIPLCCCWYLDRHTHAHAHLTHNAGADLKLRLCGCCRWGEAERASLRGRGAGHDLGRHFLPESITGENSRGGCQLRGPGVRRYVHAFVETGGFVFRMVVTYIYRYVDRSASGAYKGACGLPARCSTFSCYTSCH